MTNLEIKVGDVIRWRATGLRRRVHVGTVIHVNPYNRDITAMDEVARSYRVLAPNVLAVLGSGNQSSEAKRADGTHRSEA